MNAQTTRTNATATNSPARPGRRGSIDFGAILRRNERGDEHARQALAGDKP